MIDISKGRYWSEGIQLIDGCTPCSPGCDHCWSAAQHHRFNTWKEGWNPCRLTNGDGKFKGEIVTYPAFLKRFNTRKPKVFAIWNDLFHEGVPDSFISTVWLETGDFYNSKGEMLPAEKRRNNTYLILTKRPQRMVEFLHSRYPRPFERTNVYLGLTVCNQAEADEKIPIFLQVPGKKFLSIEPMLGKIDIKDTLYDYYWHMANSVRPTGKPKEIDAVILGGETGPGARPLHPDWVRSVRDQCQSAGVNFFFKSWGAWLPANQREFWTLATMKNAHAFIERINGNDKHVLDAIKVGRNKAGRLLDGREHNDLPWVK